MIALVAVAVISFAIGIAVGMWFLSRQLPRVLGGLTQEQLLALARRVGAVRRERERADQGE